VPKDRNFNLTPAEKKRLQDMIRKTTNLAEMEKLEKMLSEGKVPPGVILHDE